MHNVASIQRSEVDAWPIQTSGLPPRVVNATRAADLTSIGELRSWTDAQLLTLRSVGRTSLEHIHYFFRVCDQIERGEQSFPSVQEVFDIFLDRPEQDILFARYGLDRALMEASRQAVTLQEIGSQVGITRERVRQVEETGLTKLRSHLARACLQPFTDSANQQAKESDGVLTCKDLARGAHDPIYGGHNPCGVVLLLHDTGEIGLSFYNGFFSTLPTPVLEAAEKGLRNAMEKDPAPGSAHHFAEGQASEFTSDRVLEALLGHAEYVAATLDGRFFPYHPGVQGYVVELLRNTERPAHYRLITEMYNERVEARCRKGAGFILDALNDAPGCKRTGSGLYDLA